MSTPPDASGRNRPGSVDGTALTYDPNGNLTSKGDLGFAYDFRNRLSRVTDAGQEIALYTYDVFDRRIEKLVGGGVEHTVWSGWRPVETYLDGLLVGRQIHGRGLDEIAELHRNLDGDSVLETIAVPWYDSQGNPALLAAPDGRVVERYDYTPLGGREIRVDDTAPEIEQLRLRDEQIWLALSEEVDFGRIEEAINEGWLRLEDHTDPGASPLPQVTVTFEEDPESLGALSQVAASQTMSAVGRRQELRRRIVLTLPEPPPEGTSLQLVVEEAALQDLFANRPAGTWTQSFTWTSADSVVDDTMPPEVTEVLMRDGHLEVSFDEEPDLATAPGAIDLGGFTPTWELASDRFSLRSTETLPEGPYTLTIGTSLTDLVGTGLLAPFAVTFDVDASGTATLLIFAAPDPRLVTTSAVAHDFGFHGLPVDAETGLLYVRHRYYDLELGRFITADPLGYVDGPNLYQYGLNNPVSFSDPLGLEVQVDIFGFEFTISDAAEAYLREQAGKVAGFTMEGYDRVRAFQDSMDDPVPVVARQFLELGKYGVAVNEDNWRRLTDAYATGDDEVFWAEYRALVGDRWGEAKEALSHAPVGQTVAAIAEVRAQTEPYERGVWQGRVAFRAIEDLTLILGIARAPSLRSVPRGTAPRVNLSNPRVTSPVDLLKPGGRLIGEAGTSSRIRILHGGQAEARAFFERLSRGGRVVEHPTFEGTLVELPGDGLIRYRPISTSGPPTIDVSIRGVGIREIKFKQ